MTTSTISTQWSLKQYSPDLEVEGYEALEFTWLHILPTNMKYKTQPKRGIYSKKTKIKKQNVECTTISPMVSQEFENIMIIISQETSSPISPRGLNMFNW